MDQDRDLALKTEAAELFDKLPSGPRLILMNTLQTVVGKDEPLSRAYFCDFEEVLQLIRDSVKSFEEIPSLWR